MKLDPKAFAYVCAALCGASVLVIGLCNLASPGYGNAFLQVLSSVYPGYHAEPTIESVFVGTGYALVKGGAVGWLFAWLYNRVAK